MKHVNSKPDSKYYFSFSLFSTTQNLPSYFYVSKAMACDKKDIFLPIFENEHFPPEGKSSFFRARFFRIFSVGTKLDSKFCFKSKLLVFFQVKNITSCVPTAK